MNNLEFYESILNNWEIFISSLFICLLIFYLTYKRVFLSLLDPLNFSLLNSVLGATVVFFLFFIGEINSYYFSSYCLTQFAFTVGFFVFKPININEIKHGFGCEIKLKDELKFLQIVFLISSIIHLGCQFYVYLTRGIPLFMEAYLETYNVGGGFGLLSRIITTSTVISWYLLIHFLMNEKGKKMKVYLWTYMIISLLFFSVNGSKGTFLNIGLTLFLYTLINCRYSLTLQNLRSKIEKFSVKLFAVVCVMIIVILSFKSSEGVNPFIALGIRLIHSGDAYFYGYPNDVLGKIELGNGFNALFSDFLGMTRLVSWDKLPQPIGMLLLRYNHPGVEVVAGANARHNIFGLFYFGYLGSILFSFILGLLLSFSRNFLYRYLPCNVFYGLFYTLIYFCSINLESDVVLALFGLNSYIIGLLLILSISLVLYYMLKAPKYLN